MSYDQWKTTEPPNQASDHTGPCELCGYVGPLWSLGSPPQWACADCCEAYHQGNDDQLRYETETKDQNPKA